MQSEVLAPPRLFGNANFCPWDPETEKWIIPVNLREDWRALLWSVMLRGCRWELRDGAGAET